MPSCTPILRTSPDLGACPPHGPLLVGPPMACWDQETVATPLPWTPGVPSPEHQGRWRAGAEHTPQATSPTDLHPGHRAQPPMTGLPV